MDTAQIQIRSATIGDAPTLSQLAGELTTTFQFNPEAFATNLRDLLGVEHAWLRLAVRDGEVGGYLLGFRHPTFYANGQVAWLEELMIADGQRGSGIGRLLMEDFEQWATAHGCRMVALATRRATAFYHSLGYQDSATYLHKLLPAADGELSQAAPPG